MLKDKLGRISERVWMWCKFIANRCAVCSLTLSSFSSFSLRFAAFTLNGVRVYHCFSSLSFNKSQKQKHKQFCYFHSLFLLLESSGKVICLEVRPLLLINGYFALFGTDCLISISNLDFKFIVEVFFGLVFGADILSDFKTKHLTCKSVNLRHSIGARLIRVREPYEWNAEFWI